MVRDHDVIPQSFHGGSLNYLVPMIAVAFDFHLTERELFELGRVLYSSVLPVLAAFFLAGAVYFTTSKIWLAVLTMFSFVLSPVILATGLYWYPDSWIYLWTSVTILLVTVQWKTHNNSKFYRSLILIVLALGLSTKLTFVFVVFWYFFTRAYQLWRIPDVTPKEVFKSVAKDLVALLIVFLALNPGYLLRYLSALRSIVNSIFVYQIESANSGDNSNYLNGLEFHLGLIVLAIPLLVIPALFYVLNSKRETLLVSTLFPIILLVGLFSAQSQFLVRNLSVILPFAIFLGVLGLNALQESRHLVHRFAFWGSGVMISLQAIFVAHYTFANYKEDPRTFLTNISSDIGQRTIGVSDSCTNLGLPSVAVQFVDPLLERGLSDYALLTSGKSIVRGIDDPISWGRPVFWGLEFARDPNRLILADFLDLYEPKSLPEGFDHTVVRGNHFSLILLSK